MLVPRRCGADSVGRCGTCGKPVCADHRRGKQACAACADGREEPASLVTLPPDLAFDPDVLAAFEVEDAQDPVNAWSDLT